jgi:hypothetical protein
LSCDIAEKLRLNELKLSCGTCDGLSLPDEDDVLGELLPQAATTSAALHAMAVAATTLVTERKVYHLVLRRDTVGIRRSAGCACCRRRGKYMFAAHTKSIEINDLVNIAVTI